MAPVSIVSVAVAVATSREEKKVHKKFGQDLNQDIPERKATTLPLSQLWVVGWVSKCFGLKASFVAIATTFYHCCNCNGNKNGSSG